MSWNSASYPRAIVHLDGDGFFAACEQARDPSLRGKPVVTGKERGIAAAMSYEAKRCGVTRGMRLFEIKKVCPDAIILPSDYEMYSLVSARMYEVVRRYTPQVEEYSIDECFADLTGMRRVHRASYEHIVAQIRVELKEELGCTFSAGIAPTKVLAKIASKRNKPDGLCAIPGHAIEKYLADTPIEKIWGIGGNTAALMKKYRIHTALDLARMSEPRVRQLFSKPFVEIWRELRGESVHAVDTSPRPAHRSMQKFKTFTPPSSDKVFIRAQLSKNIENVCIKARRHRLAAREISVILRAQDFRHSSLSRALDIKTAYPDEVIAAAEPLFEKLYESRKLYRATGIVLAKLEPAEPEQMDLFGASVARERSQGIYDAVDRVREKYGKHGVFLASSLPAHTYEQHQGERGDVPKRYRERLPGESERKRLDIPLLDTQI